MDNIAAIILSAGKGTRANSTTSNKVMLDINGKPLLSYTIDRLYQSGISEIIVVVGFAKESIMNYFKDSVRYAVQKKQQGTADALASGLSQTSASVQTILSVSGDDSYSYSPELLTELIEIHQKHDADITLLTTVLNNPLGIGRVIRNVKGEVEKIVEEKELTDEQKKIAEINTACYVFRKSFIEEYLPKISNHNAAHEYYLTDIIGLAVENGKKVIAVTKPDLAWRGVNTQEDLSEAEKIVTN